MARRCSGAGHDEAPSRRRRRPAVPPGPGARGPAGWRRDAAERAAAGAGLRLPGPRRRGRLQAGEGLGLASRRRRRRRARCSPWEAALRWWRPGGARGSGAAGPPPAVRAVLALAARDPPAGRPAGGRGRQIPIKALKSGARPTRELCFLRLMVNANSVLAAQKPRMRLEQYVRGPI